MKKIAMELAFVLLMAVSAFSQTELFSQDVSGIHPYTGLKWNSKITQPLVGLDYIIEGRTALGFQVATPVKDSAFATPSGADDSVASSFHSFFFNPYVVFEFVEPDNVLKFSFSVRGDYIYDRTLADSHLNSITQSSFGVGPIVAYHFQAGDKVDIIPKASYEFFYTEWKRNWPTHVDVNGNSDALYNDVYLNQSNITGAVDAVFHLTETQGINLEPKAVFKVGDGLRGSDLVNIELQLGYFLSF